MRFYINSSTNVSVVTMSELQEKHQVIDHVFQQYDFGRKGELSPVEVMMLHSDIRMGGISLPQVQASIKYVCATDLCYQGELFDLLQELDRRYFLIQDLRWEFSLLDREHKNVISEDQARWMVQAVYGRKFSRKKWEEFCRSRSVPGSSVSFAEIEVMLCDIPSLHAAQVDKKDDEKDKQGKLQKLQKVEEAADKERQRLQKEKSDIEEKKKQDDEDRRRRLRHQEEEEERQKREEEEERRRAEEAEEARLRELEEEEDRKRREEAAKFSQVERIAQEAESSEKEAEKKVLEAQVQQKLAKDAKNRKDAEEDERTWKKKHIESKHKRIRYRLKVAIKARDRYQLEYTITEFKQENLTDHEMDLAKAEKLLKELTSRDDLKKAMSQHEIDELERAIKFVHKNGFEAQLAKELIEANKLLARLKRLERIRHEILELKQATVAEIRSYQNPPIVVHHVMTATFLMLGHKEKDTKDWKAVQALVGKTGREGLRHRCVKCDPTKISPMIAKRAKLILDKYVLDEVRDVSAGAATFYVWCSTIVEDVLDREAKEEEARLQAQLNA